MRKLSDSIIEFISLKPAPHPIAVSAQSDYAFPMITGMNHFTAIAADPKAALDFYENLLGLKAGYRPDLGFPGAWLYAGETTVLHLYFDRPVPNPAAGVIDHMAFTTQDLKSFKARFDALGYPYKLKRRDGGPWQLFCHDPSGARIELNFSASESLD